MGDRSRWISESKASLDPIVSCRTARATQRYPALKDGERREREGGREREREEGRGRGRQRETDRQAGTETQTQTHRDRESQSHRKPSEY